MDLLFPMTMGVTFFLLNILKNTNDEDTRKLVIFYHLLYHDLFTNCITLIAFKSFCTTTFQSLLLYLDENKEIIPSIFSTLFEIFIFCPKIQLLIFRENYLT